ncbi:MAG: metallophosphoesterase family protein [Caldilineales bacterium]|nr:metallophosphoesterase family protein [Caldilineales bacterium]
MRIAIISDIHANLVALETVLAVIDELGPDEIWCLGDTAGYGPEPEACLSLIRERATLCLAGNHDLAVAGRIPLEDFHSLAVAAIRWQRQRLPKEMIDWLGDLPSIETRYDITLAHASPRDPVFEYVTDGHIAAANASAFATDWCLIGHSHLAIAWLLRGRPWLRQDAQLTVTEPEQPLALGGSPRWLLNPGSVGQPRDRDPRASFALLDTEARTWTWHRIDYDIAATVEAIWAAGLPERLGSRLFEGW